MLLKPIFATLALASFAAATALPNVVSERDLEVLDIQFGKYAEAVERSDEAGLLETRDCSSGYAASTA
jgi:hypothetical protein